MRMQQSKTIFGKYLCQYFEKIDCTHSSIFKPSVGQRKFFCGDKKKHSILTSVCTDVDNIIIHLVYNVAGRNNDVQKLYITKVASSWKIDR